MIISVLKENIEDNYSTIALHFFFVFQEMPSLQTVMGENKADYASRLENGKQFIRMVIDSNLVHKIFTSISLSEFDIFYLTFFFSDEISPEKLPAINPLADLVLRQETEQNYLLTWLRSSEIKAMTFARRRQGLVKMLLEKLCVEQETDYTCMGYRLGLLERIEAALENRFVIQ